MSGGCPTLRKLSWLSLLFLSLAMLWLVITASQPACPWALGFGTILHTHCWWLLWGGVGGCGPLRLHVEALWQGWNPCAGRVSCTASVCGDAARGPHIEQDGLPASPGVKVGGSGDAAALLPSTPALQKRVPQETGGARVRPCRRREQTANSGKRRWRWRSSPSTRGRSFTCLFLAGRKSLQTSRLTMLAPGNVHIPHVVFPK